MEIILFFLIAFGVLLAFAIGVYNRLITLRNRSDNAWAQVDVQLRRRYDLIPNLSLFLLWLRIILISRPTRIF
jgi:LemA protein